VLFGGGAAAFSRTRDERADPGALLSGREGWEKPEIIV
jgi:hypothetical protein